MYTKILVPLDGSKCAEAILPHVERLAQCFGAKIIFLQVVEPSHVPLDPEGYLPEIDAERTERRKGEAAAYLAACQAKFQEKAISTIVLVETGPVVEKIIETARKEEVGLIAMASHGRTGLARVFYGSVADGVLHRVDRPLFLVRAREEKRHPVEKR